MIPNFEAFAARNSIDGTTLRSAEAFFWNEYPNGFTGKDYGHWAAKCEKLAPRPEDFDDILVSAAMDAAVATAMIFRCLEQRDVERIVEISTLARDSVDMYVQEIENLDPQDPNLEKKIENHPLMLLEVQRQVRTVDLLEQLLPQGLQAESTVKSIVYQGTNGSLGI